MNHYEFFSSDDILIKVGKDAQSNDHLSFQASHPNDWWMHWEGGPGAHVVICSRDNSIDSTFPETLKDAAILALRHSKAKPIDTRKYAVTLTRPCHLHKPRGAKDGMVQIMLSSESLQPGKCVKQRKHTRRKCQQMVQVTEGDMSSSEVRRYHVRYDEARYQRVVEC
mmetsp:Transcript_21361/g.39871  ORF Transcript_21361/g.39871 Transcript_21361/m.39871 type:complete len:167 (+) Transcript_21361:51-551(+)